MTPFATRPIPRDCPSPVSLEGKLQFALVELDSSRSGQTLRGEVLGQVWRRCRKGASVKNDRMFSESVWDF